MSKLTFGTASSKHLDEMHPALAYVFREALAYGVMDFSIIEACRDQARQNRLYNLKKSMVIWPHSKHNLKPGDKLVSAGDAVPWINGKESWNKLHCCVLAGVILAAAAKLGIKIRWGGNWDQDLEPITDQDFQDLVHYELSP